MVGKKVAGLVEVWKDVMLLFFLFDSILERYNNYLFIFVSGISKRHGTLLFKPVRSHTDRLYKLRNRSK